MTKEQEKIKKLVKKALKKLRRKLPLYEEKINY